MHFHCATDYAARKLGMRIPFINHEVKIRPESGESINHANQSLDDVGGNSKNVWTVICGIRMIYMRRTFEASCVQGDQESDFQIVASNMKRRAR